MHWLMNRFGMRLSLKQAVQLESVPVQLLQGDLQKLHEKLVA
jgi:hypothetical protein